MILVIDNYDSFTYNLVQLIGTRTAHLKVVRNDDVSVDQIRDMKPNGIVISPGPGRPAQAGICISLIQTLGNSIPILGVCLGHQAIGHAFGGQIVHAPQLMHGKTSQIIHENDSLFSNIQNPFEATRYHSLVISPTKFPAELSVTARTSDGTIMAVRHKKYPIVGIQFHPESILTEAGATIIENWLSSTTEIA